MSSKAAATKTPQAKPVAAKPAAAPAKAPAKPAALAAKAAPPAAKAPATQPTEAHPVVEETEKSAGVEEKKKSRQQATSVLQINISSARVNTHLKQDLGDKAIETQIKDHRADLKKAKAAGDTVKVDILKKRIAELSKNLVRLSAECPIATAAIMDVMVKEIVRHGMDQTIASETKLVEVKDLHEGAPTAILYYPLFNKCPTWADYSEEHEDDLRAQRMAANKAAKEAREQKKAAEEKKAGAKAAPQKAAPHKANHAEPAAKDEDEEDSHAEHSKTTFVTYVENALKFIKKENPKYSAMRVSNRVREYLSNIIQETLKRISVLARQLVTTVAEVRTMNAGHIMAAVNLLMIDEGRSEEQIKVIADYVAEKLALYRKHVQTEKANKASSLSAEKKAEQTRKQLEAELARKAKAAEVARKRAEESAKKAAELQTETAALAPIVEANRKKAEEEETKKKAAEEEEAKKKAAEGAEQPAAAPETKKPAAAVAPEAKKPAAAAAPETKKPTAEKPIAEKPATAK